MYSIHIYVLSLVAPVQCLNSEREQKMTMLIKRKNHEHLNGNHHSQRVNIKHSRDF